MLSDLPIRRKQAVGVMIKSSLMICTLQATFQHSDSGILVRSNNHHTVEEHCFYQSLSYFNGINDCVRGDYTRTCCVLYLNTSREPIGVNAMY